MGELPHLMEVIMFRLLRPLALGTLIAMLPAQAAENKKKTDEKKTEEATPSFFGGLPAFDAAEVEVEGLETAEADTPAGVAPPTEERALELDNTVMHGPDSKTRDTVAAGPGAKEVSPYRIDRLLRATYPDMAGCFADSRSKAGKTRVRFTFMLHPDAEITELKLTTTPKVKGKATECVQQVLEGIRMPLPRTQPARLTHWVTFHRE